MTIEMYEDLLKRKQLQIDEYWELINEQDEHIKELQEENERLVDRNDELLSLCKYLYANRGRVLFTDDEMDEKYKFDALARRLLEKESE